MNKKFSVLFILLAFLFTAFYTVNGMNNKYSAGAENNILSLHSQSAYLVDADTKTVLFAKNETERRPIASMCKIMTLLLTFEAIDNGDFNADSDIRVSDNASAMGGSQVFLAGNTDYKASELIKSIVVASANDASVAMAEKIAGSEQAFVEMMNAKAESLGMENTLFVNCTGLPKLGQYSCAKDVSTMFGELIKHRNYFDYSNIWMDEVAHPEGRITEISNTNKLIRFYDGCDSGKTGYTAEAGHCICASAIRNGLRLISVVIKAPDSKTRFKETSDMFNYGFNTFTSKIVVAKKPISVTAAVLNGQSEEVIVEPESEVRVLSKINEKRSFEVDFEPIDRIVAPIKTGDVVGKISVYENGVLITTVNAVSSTDVAKATYFDRLQKIIKRISLFG